jgi:hypothetical protein
MIMTSIRNQIFSGIVSELISIRIGVQNGSSVIVIQERISFPSCFWEKNVNPVLEGL